MLDQGEQTLGTDADRNDHPVGRMVCDHHWTCEPPQVQRQWRLKTEVRRTKLLSNTTTNEKTPRRSRRSTLVGEHSTDPGRSSLGRRGALGANPDRNTSCNPTRCGA